MMHERFAVAVAVAVSARIIVAHANCGRYKSRMQSRQVLTAFAALEKDAAKCPGRILY
jgi:hypothetical protein